MKKIIILVIICLIFAINIYAMPPSGITSQTVTMTEIEGLGNKILGAIQTIGYLVAVAVLMYIGIKLMLASPSERAQVKGMMVPYLVGAIIAFATSAVATIILNIANKITA